MKGLYYYLYYDALLFINILEWRGSVVTLFDNIR